MEICIIIGSFTLLLLAFFIMINTHICDNHQCDLFSVCINKNEKDNVIYLLDNLFNESLWAFGLIVTLIITLLLFYTLSIKLTLVHFMLVFVLTFLVYFCIIAFLRNHYALPMQKYIKNHIKKHNFKKVSNTFSHVNK